MNNYNEFMKVIMSDSWGIYIPQRWTEHWYHDGWTIDTTDDLDELFECINDGPENESYWDAWDEIYQNAYFTDEHDKKWFLYQDGNLFIVSEDMPEDLWL